MEKAYQGSFTLSDVVILIKQGDTLTDNVYAPSSSDTGIGLLITDEEKVIAEQGQLIAQDLARKLASSELEAVGIIIPDIKSNMIILDELSLDKFQINGAMVIRTDSAGPAFLNFKYNSAIGLITNVTTEEGYLLIEAVAAAALDIEVTSVMQALEAELKAISDLDVYIKQNDLYIFPEDIIYIQDGSLQVTDLEVLNLGLKVTGIFDLVSEKFTRVSHELLSAESIDLKDYFEQLAVLYLVDYLQKQGIEVTESQIETAFPFSTIELTTVSIGSVFFNFKIDPVEDKALAVEQIGGDFTATEMTVEELVTFASQQEEIREETDEPSEEESL